MRTCPTHAIALLLGVVGALGFETHAEAGSLCTINSVGSAVIRTCTTSTKYPANSEWDCRSGPCDFCGICHGSRTQREGRFETAGHLPDFNRRKIDIAEGKPVQWAKDIVLGRAGNRLCLRSSGEKELVCFPGNAVYFRLPRGNETVIFSPTPATVSPDVKEVNK